MHRTSTYKTITNIVKLFNYFYFLRGCTSVLLYLSIYVFLYMAGWLAAWMAGWLDGWLGGWMHEWLDAGNGGMTWCMDGWGSCPRIQTDINNRQI